MRARPSGRGVQAPAAGGRLARWLGRSSSAGPRVCRPWPSRARTRDWTSGVATNCWNRWASARNSSCPAELAGQVPRAPGPGRRAGAHLDLAEHRGLGRREAHIAGQHELAAGAPRPPAHLGDSQRRHLAQRAEQQAQGRVARAARLPGLGRVFGHLGQVDVRDEEIRVGGFEHHHPDAGLAGQGADQADQVAHQVRPDEVDRRRVDPHRQDTVVQPGVQRGK